MLKIKDLLGIALISICVFPLILMALLFAMDLLRVDVGMSDKVKDKTNAYLRKYHPKQDQAEIKHMKSLEALKKQEKEMAEKQAAVNREIERLKNLKLENVTLKEEVIANRKRIEELIATSEAMTHKRMQALAEVYGSMRPEEAAPILLTLENKMIAEIIRQIPEVRSQSKIMGALGALDVKRAAAVSKLMGRAEDSKS